MVVVSLMTQEPDKATQKMVDDVRVPSGKTILGKSHEIIFLKGRLTSPLLFHIIFKYKFSHVC